MRALRTFEVSRLLIQIRLRIIFGSFVLGPLTSTSPPVSLLTFFLHTTSKLFAPLSPTKQSTAHSLPIPPHRLHLLQLASQDKARTRDDYVGV
jgi:hypothetical protein